MYKLEHRHFKNKKSLPKLKDLSNDFLFIIV